MNTKEKKRSKIEIKNTTTVIKLSLKYSLMSGGNTFKVELNLELLPLT